jgi:hypothetical protein
MRLGMLVIVRDACQVIILLMNGEAGLMKTHWHALRRGRHRFVGGHNERVSLLIQEVIVPSERGELDLAEVATDFDERELAEFDVVKERLGYQ